MSTKTRSPQARILASLFPAVLVVFAAVAPGWTQDAVSAGPGVGDVVVGTWECDGSPPPFKVTKNFEAGGTMMEIDNITPLESPTIGSWKRVGYLRYFLVARQYTYDSNQNWVGTFHYTQPLTMDPSYQTMQGTFHFVLLDPNGQVLDSGDGQVSCRRMALQ
jgi:hypothetical protein